MSGCCSVLVTYLDSIYSEGDLQNYELISNRGYQRICIKDYSLISYKRRCVA